MMLKKNMTWSEQDKNDTEMTMDKNDFTTKIV